MASLTVLKGQNAGERREFTARELVIGRHPECGFVVPEETVSRRHARILRGDDGHYFVEDLGSRNGTSVNGRRITGVTRLEPHDQIRIDTVVLGFDMPVPDLDRDLRTGEIRVLPGSGVELIDITSGESDLDRPSSILFSLDATRAADRVTGSNAQVKLRALLQITREVSTSLDIDQILSRTLDSLFRIFPQSDRGYVLLLDDENGELRPAAIKQRSDIAEAAVTLRPIANSMARQVLDEGTAILGADPTDDGSTVTETVIDFESRSMMCAPLTTPLKERLGILYLDTTDPTRRFSEDDLSVLANVAALVGQAVEHARLHKAQIELARREHEIEAARQVQRHFLPREAPATAGYEFFDFYEAADAVGGDYLGYLALPRGRVAIAVGDVAGKGVSAALVMARFCSDVRYCLATHPSPAEAVSALNRSLTSGLLSGRFVTFSLCVLDPLAHTLSVVNAGHIPPLWRHGETGRVESIGAAESGTPLGFDAESSYRQVDVRLEPGDVVLMYTDGASEAKNAAGGLFGNERIRSLLAGTRDGPGEVGAALLDALRSFSFGDAHDDLCIAAFGRTSNPRGAR